MFTTVRNITEPPCHSRFTLHARRAEYRTSKRHMQMTHRVKSCSRAVPTYTHTQPFASSWLLLSHRFPRICLSLPVNTLSMRTYVHVRVCMSTATNFRDTWHPRWCYAVATASPLICVVWASSCSTCSTEGHRFGECLTITIYVDRKRLWSKIFKG